MGRPLIAHLLGALRAAGVGQIAVVSDTDLGPAVGDGVAMMSGMAACRPWLEGSAAETLVLSGDLPLLSPRTLEAMVAFGREKNAEAVMASGCSDDPRGYSRVARDASGAFVRVVPEAAATEEERKIQEVSPGAYLVRTASLLESLTTGMEELVGRWAAGGRRIETLRPPDPAEIFAVHNHRDLVAATNFLRWRVLERLMGAGVSIVDPSTTYIEEDVTVGAGTLIHPFSVIRAGVRIGAGCEVGPFAHLRAGSVLKDGAEVGDFVELKNTVLGEHAKAKHLSYLGDATVGSRVNIGAGTITANYDGKAKHPTVIEEGAFTGCNTVLVAPVTMKKNSKTGAGAVVPRGQDVPEGTTVVGVPARPIQGRKRS